MSVQQRRKYDTDFKRNAVQLTDEPGRKVVEVAENLGIGKDLLYRWRREHRAQHGVVFPGNGKEALSVQEKKIRELEKKLKDTEMERGILKKGSSGKRVLCCMQVIESEFEIFHVSEAICLPLHSLNFVVKAF